MINRSKRKFLKVSAYILGSLIVLLVGFHFWFINHAERLIEQLVESRSNGKLKLHVQKFKFNWLSKDMQLRNAVFYSTDTNTAARAYRLSIEKIDISVKEIYPLIFEKKILIDSLRLINTDITVTRLRSVKDADTSKDKSTSISLEMGKVYTSIQDALQVLQVNRFQIDNGKFTLINKIRPDEIPVTISHIYFHLDNLQVDSSNTTTKQKILFSDNVSLHTYNQDILFPDGRHRLSFSNFHINIVKKIVEFDSCTIAAIRNDSSKSSFSVFFDKLQMTNIDFDTLYQKEVIKADSIYCINPRFKLDVELEKNTGKTKPPPRLDEIIRQLTGDMQVAFVVVNNGSFDINTMREGKPSSFTSNNNNFEMQGLRIAKDASRHLTVKTFAMAIRNYENFLRDSTYAMEFDSILFINNSIYLSNFSFRQMEDGKVINSFSMPQFELKGLSWDDLVFDRKLTAARATLYRPVINYSLTENNSEKNKKQEIFQTLAGIGKIIQLNNLHISDGQINVHFNGGAQLQLENANMFILGKDLVQSNRVAGLQRSVSEIQFKKGLLKIGDLSATMEDVDFAGKNGQLTAGSIHIISKEKNISINAKKVAVNSMMIDNDSYITEINGIQWQEAEVQVTASPMENNNQSQGFILRNIEGGNTKLSTTSGNQKINVFLESVSAEEFLPGPKDKLRITNLQANGKTFLLTGNNLQLTIDHFHFADHKSSAIENISFKNNTATDSISVIIPTADFAPDLTSIIKGDIVADNVKIVQPQINIKQFHHLDIEADEENKLPGVAIGKLTILQPELSFQQSGDKDASIEWNGKKEKNNFLELTNFKIQKNPSPIISADQLEFALNNFTVTAGRKTLTTGKGSISTRITGLHLDSLQTNHLSWKGVIAELRVKDLLLDSLGKKAGRLEIISARLNDLTVKSHAVLSLREIVKENAAFRLKEATGVFDNETNHFDWHNLNYDKTTKTLSVDSFTYRPTPGKDSFVASHRYQSDYITLSTGVINAGPLDVDKYLTDTVINAGVVNVSNVAMKVFRDKRKPAQTDIVKPLPVNLLKKIPAHLSIDTLNLTTSNIEYAELNEKTNQTGVIPANRLTGKAFPVNNYNMQPGDSFHLDARAWVMDSLWMALKLSESYTDSLAGFLLSANAGPGDTRALNSMLGPLVSVQIESGFLDTISMHVVGREYVSIGEMQMYYRNLKIKLLTNGVGKKKQFLKSFVTFLANNFIIKKDNHSRTGVIFFERVRNKSTMNYLVKITISGIASSIGAKNNKKLVRNYKKELRKRNLPPLEYD